MAKNDIVINGVQITSGIISFIKSLDLQSGFESSYVPGCIDSLDEAQDYLCRELVDSGTPKYKKDRLEKILWNIIGIKDHLKTLEE